VYSFEKIGKLINAKFDKSYRHKQRLSNVGQFIIVTFLFKKGVKFSEYAFQNKGNVSLCNALIIININLVSILCHCRSWVPLSIFFEELTSYINASVQTFLRHILLSLYIFLKICFLLDKKKDIERNSILCIVLDIWTSSSLIFAASTKRLNYQFFQESTHSKTWCAPAHTNITCCH